MRKSATKSNLHVLVILLAVQLFGLSSFAQDVASVDSEDNSWMLWQTEYRHRWLMYHLEKGEVEFLKARWAAIENSLIDNQTEHSGYYIIPAYMSGYFLIWSQEVGYVFVRFFDIEHPCYFSFGDVELEGDAVKFVHEGESGASVCSTKRPAEKWVPALGGQYFVPVPELESFADYYAGLGKFNGYFRQFESHPAFPIKLSKSPDPDPSFILPKEFSRFVKAPLEGEITEVGKTRQRNGELFFGHDKESVTPVTINMGKEDGVKLRQEFALLTGDNGSNETLIVTRVGKRSSKGVIVRGLDESGNETYPRWNSAGDRTDAPFSKIRSGIRVTTSPLSKL